MNHSQSADLKLEAVAKVLASGGMPVVSASQMSVTSTAVTSTTNMTGFLISSRGSSFRKAWGMAERSRSGSRTPRGWAVGAGGLFAAQRHEPLEAARAATKIDGE